MSRGGGPEEGGERSPQVNKFEQAWVVLTWESPGEHNDR